jgi:hypothetical protein
MLFPDAGSRFVLRNNFPSWSNDKDTSEGFIPPVSTCILELHVDPLSLLICVIIDIVQLNAASRLPSGNVTKPGSMQGVPREIALCVDPIETLQMRFPLSHPHTASDITNRAATENQVFAIRNFSPLL